ncbi:MAG: SdrD B-like domain-containing protein, partial [Saprospiraceae bacterium]
MNEIKTNPRIPQWLKLCVGLIFITIFTAATTTAPAFLQRSYQQLRQQIYEQIIVSSAISSSASKNNNFFNPPPCTSGSGTIGGVTFQDFNLNGDDDQVGNISGIEVAIYRCDADGNSTLVNTTTSDADGTYSFSGLTDGETYRVEFRIPEAMSYLTHGSGAGDKGTNVQFVTAPTCEVDAGFLNSADYCEENPLIAAACYVNGDPLAAGSGSADEEAIVAFRYNATGNDEKIKLATAAEVGSVYGMAYEKTAKRIYTSAFIKRHVGLGPLGLGGIYQIDLSTENPVVTPFIDVTSIGINVGDFPTNAERQLSANPALPNNDAPAYDAVGKWGLGGISISDDEKTLWLVNLALGTLHSIVIDSDNNPATAPTAGDVQTFNLPTASCAGGTFRPFAVNYHQDAVYIGGVCDAALSQQESDLEAVIYRFANGNFTEVTRFDLDYEKGYTTFTNDCEDFPGWYPWRADLPEACSSNGIFRVYPTPILTDMVFDVDNSLVLGFTDRMGHQIGFKNYPLEGTSPLLQTVSGGDILRLHNNNGNYELENNGSAGGVTTAGAGNGEGPNGGEFYYRDVFEGPIDNLTSPQPHTETAQGGLAFIPGSGEVVSTALDPYSTQFNAGGVNWFNNQTGEQRNPGFLLYRSSNSNISTFSKANGLGDIISMCELAPVEIGTR